MRIIKLEIFMKMYRHKINFLKKTVWPDFDRVGMSEVVKLFKIVRYAKIHSVLNFSFE